MDPLSLVARLAAAVPPPRFHTVKYAGVLASAHKWRARIAPEKPDGHVDALPEQGEKPKRRGVRRRARGPTCSTPGLGPHALTG